MDKRGAKKRTRVNLFRRRARKGSGLQLSTAKGKTAMCVCVYEREGEGEKKRELTHNKGARKSLHSALY